VKECVCCPLTEENEQTISSWRRRGDGLLDGGRGKTPEKPLCACVGETFVCVCGGREGEGERDSGRSWKMCNHIPMNKISSQKTLLEESTSLKLLMYTLGFEFYTQLTLQRTSNYVFCLILLCHTHTFLKCFLTFFLL